MKRLLSILLIVLLSTDTYAQVNVSYRPIVALYDLDSTSDFSCISTPLPQNARIKTTGSSTTTAAVTTGAQPFILASVGDIIYANVFVSGSTRGPSTGRVITAKASGDSVTVDSAWDLGTIGTSYIIWKATCAATSVTGGWMNVKGNLKTEIYVSIDQLVVTSGGLGIKIEAKDGEIADSFTTPTNVWPGETAAAGATACGSATWTAGYCVYTTAGNAARVRFSTNEIIHPAGLRVVMKMTNTDNDTTPATDNEKVNIFVTEVR